MSGAKRVPSDFTAINASAGKLRQNEAEKMTSVGGIVSAGRASRPAQSLFALKTPAAFLLGVPNVASQHSGRRNAIRARSTAPTGSTGWWCRAARPSR